MKAFRVECLVGLSVMMGCGASLSTRRVESGAAVQGVPFRLPVASFVISESPASADKPTTYTLGLVETPDASEIYDLRLNTGAFASSELALSFGGQGQLAGLNTSFTPAVVPFVEAVGDFAIGALGVAAKVAGRAALDTSDREPPGLIGELEQIERTPSEICTRRADVRKVGEKVNTNSAVQRDYEKLLSICKAEAPTAVKEMRSRLNPDRDDATNFNRLYATDDTQRAALDAAANAVKTFTHENLDAAGSDYTGNDPKKKEQIDRIEKAIAALDKTAVAREAPLDEKLAKKLARVKALAISTINERKLAKGFEESAKLSPREWRHRHANAIEDRIDLLARELALTPAAEPSKLAAREKLERQWAIAVDGLGEFERAAVLRRQLLGQPRSGPPRPGPGSPPLKPSEYAVARTELDVLMTTLAQKRQVLKPTFAPGPKAQPREIRLMPEYLDEPGISTKEWVGKRAKELGYPEFMVVVEKGVLP